MSSQIAETSSFSRLMSPKGLGLQLGRLLHARFVDGPTLEEVLRSNDAKVRDPAFSVRFQVPSRLACREQTDRKREARRKVGRKTFVADRIDETLQK